MTFTELVSSRYSVRKFRPDAIPAEVLSAILEAGRCAPTAVNYQPQKIYIVKDPAKRQAMAALTPMQFAFTAPTLLVIGYDKNLAWKNKQIPGYCSGEADAAIVATHMMLAAWEQGVGSCWVGVFSDKQIAEALDLPENIQVTAMMPLGYPAEDAAPGPLHGKRRPLEETVAEL